MLAEEGYVLCSAFFGYWIILHFLILVSKNMKRSLIVNLSIHALYSSILIYALSISKGYESMGMAFAILFALGVHGSINLIQLIYLLIRKKNS